MFSVDKYKGLTILQTWTKVASIPHYLALACKAYTYRLPMHKHARYINCMFATFYRYYWATCNDGTWPSMSKMETLLNMGTYYTLEI